MSPQQVFFYQILKFSKDFDEWVTLSEATGYSKCSMFVNQAANIHGYTLYKPMYALATEYLQHSDRLTLEDLAITILLMNFSKRYVKSQYHLFVNDFEPIFELGDFERKLLKCSNTYFKLPKNLAIHSEFGILALQSRFVNTGSISLTSFNILFKYMAST